MTRLPNAVSRNTTGHALCEAFGYTPHIKRIGEEKLDKQGEKTYPVRRWVHSV